MNQGGQGRRFSYLGLAPVRLDESGSATFRRSELRFAPEFGYDPEPGPEQEAPVEPGYDYEFYDMPGGTPTGIDPTGLTAIPDDAGWMERDAWTTEMLNVDTEMATDGDVDAYDSMNVPDEYSTMVAGAEAESAWADAAFGGDDFGDCGPSGCGPGDDNLDFMGTDYEFGEKDDGTDVTFVPQPGTDVAVPQRRPQSAAQSAQGKWQKTAVSQWTNVLTAVGAGLTVTFSQTVAIRPQHDFVGVDCVFQPNTTIGGLSPGGTLTLNWAAVQAITFGDHIVWQVQAPGIPVQVFGTSAVTGGASFMRGVIKGAKLRGGLDIQCILNWNVTDGGAGTPANDVQIAAICFGLKPQRTCL